MAVHNGASFVAESVASVLAQTTSDLELLIVDDGSTDESVRICRGFNDARIRILARQRSGLTASLIAGLAEARGEFVARLDHDDVASPNRLERQVAALDAFPSVVLVGSNATLIDTYGRSVGQTKIPEHRDALYRHLASLNGMVHSSLCFRLRPVLALGGYRPQFLKAQDYDLLLRVIETHEIRCLTDRLISLRQHTESITATDQECVQMRSALAALVAHHRRGAGHADPVDDPPMWQDLVAAVDAEFRTRGLARSASAKRGIVVARAAARSFDVPRLARTVLQVVRTDWRAATRRGFGTGFPDDFIAAVLGRLSGS